MKTSINLRDSLVSEIQLWNKEHPDKQIGISGTCRKALEDALSRAKGRQHTEVTRNPALKSEA